MKHMMFNAHSVSKYPQYFLSRVRMGAISLFRGLAISVEEYYLLLRYGKGCTLRNLGRKLT